MTSTLPTSSTPNNAAQSPSGAPASASGSSQARSSYANATKSKPAGPPPIASSTPAIVGGAAQHGKVNSSTPVNGNSSSPAPGSGAPAIVSSGSISNGDHSRKPSVTISAQGTSGYLPNGSSGTQTSRPNIHFGQMNASGSPAVAHSVPHNPHNANLGASPANQGQARSPSPIPQAPAVSGGRPPSGAQGQGNQLNFGNLAGSEGPEQGHRPSPLPSGPASLAQPQHLRRESAQSQHSEMSNPMNRNFSQGSSRGRGYNPQYPNNMPHSPQVFRQSPAMTPRNLSNVPSFQPQGPMRGAPGSPYLANRSPATQPASMHQQPHMANGQPIPQPYGYPHHLNPQNPGIYGAPPQADYYQGYYGQPFIPPNMHGIPYNAPASPRFTPAQHGPHQGYMPGPYNPPTHNMSRQSSHQGSERASSTVPQASTPNLTNAQPPPVVSSSPGPASRPEPRKSKAIVIKNADGEVVDLKNISASAATTPVQSRPPPVVSSGAGVPSTSTPPPRPISSSSSQHNRSESQPQPQKSAEEAKRQFAEQFKKNLQGKAGLTADKDEPTTEAKAEEVKPVETVAEKVKEQPKEEPKEEPKKEESKPVEPEAPAEEDDEAWIRELEEQERQEEERERKYQEKKKEEKAKKDAEAAAKLDDDLKRAEREAEAREEAKAKNKSTEPDDADKADFAKLKRPTFGPGANASSGTDTPTESMPPPPAPTPASGSGTPLSRPIPGRPKPSALKLETSKIVEPAQPTAGMKSLSSARFLRIQAEDNIYPDGIKSPNPALNHSAKNRGRQYDKDFLLQFQEVFKEKPSVDWDKMLRDTVGDGAESARPSAGGRTPSMGGRQNSRGPGPAMGSFGIGGQNRTLPAGTTSEQRFAAANSGRGSMVNPLAQFAPQGRGMGTFPMVGGMGTPMSRSGSTQSRGPNTLNSPRTGSTRSSSRRDGQSHQNSGREAKTMPLTAGKEVKALEVSRSGWKAASLVAPATSQPNAAGHLAPDVVQRKVKSSLNKMTPEKFEKISGDILLIAGQSKDETDGRTLRQVIQLTFEKACDEAHWASMYAKFCKRMMETMSRDIKDENVKDKNGQPVVGGALFRKYLLNRCQEEFERGWEINLPAKPEGEAKDAEAVMLSDEYYVAAAAKRRGLGLIQFIGELYKLGMLTIRIMHECVVKLLNFDGVPEESTIESLVKLLRTIGATMDANQPIGRDMVSMYFERIDITMKLSGLPSRLYYMLLDTVEMRKKGWATKDADKGPKTIGEIHQEAAQKAAQADMERQKSARGGGRPQIGRGDSRMSYGAPPAQDYNRTTVGMDDLKKLGSRVRANVGGPGSMGPSTLGSRSGSRRGLGPPVGNDSAASSRTGTPPVKDKESTASVNTFSALAALNADDADNEVTSPPSTAASPALAKSKPAGKPEDEPNA